MAIILNDVVSPNNTSIMNANFQKIEDSINNDLLKREIEVGEANEMRTHLDFNNNKSVNMLDGVDPQDSVTVKQMEAFQDTIQDGEDGYTPVKGVDYFDGADGATGPEGPAGPQGDPGADGSDGADGEGSGIVVSVVAGTNVTVDDTDPANPIVSSTSSSGGLQYAEELGPLNKVPSTSPHASKGLFFSPNVDLVLHSVHVDMSPLVGEAYKVYLVQEEELIPRQIASIVGESNSLTWSVLSGQERRLFTFSIPILLPVSAAKYAILATVTSGSATTASRVPMPSSLMNAGKTHLTTSGQIIADTNLPTVGQTLPLVVGSEDRGSGFTLNYSLV